MIGQQFQQLWTSDDNIHPLQDEPYKSTFFFFNTPDHEELNAEDASTGSVYSVGFYRHHKRLQFHSLCGFNLKQP